MQMGVEVERSVTNWVDHGEHWASYLVFYFVFDDIYMSQHKAHLSAFLGKAKVGMSPGAPATARCVASSSEMVDDDRRDVLRKRKGKHLKLARKKLDRYTGLNDGAGQLKRLEPR